MRKKKTLKIKRGDTVILASRHTYFHWLFSFRIVVSPRKYAGNQRRMGMSLITGLLKIALYKY